MKGSTKIEVHWSSGLEAIEDPEEREWQRQEMLSLGTPESDFGGLAVNKVVVDGQEVAESNVYPGDFRQWVLRGPGDQKNEGQLVLEQWFD